MMMMTNFSPEHLDFHDLNTLFFLLRTSKILPSLNVLIMRACFSLKCSYFVFILAAVAINASPCKNCYGWHARFKIQLFLVGNSLLWVARTFQSSLLAGHSVPYTDKQYMHACNQLVVHIVSQTTE